MIHFLQIFLTICVNDNSKKNLIGFGKDWFHKSKIFLLASSVKECQPLTAKNATFKK